MSLENIQAIAKELRDTTVPQRTAIIDIGLQERVTQNPSTLEVEKSRISIKKFQSVCARIQ